VDTKEVSITPLSYRYFDAFYIKDEDNVRNPIQLGINHHLIDYVDYDEQFALYGKHYELTFKLYSLNFPAISETFVVDKNGARNTTICLKPRRWKNKFMA
jgi:hypothetical protein